MNWFPPGSRARSAVCPSIPPGAISGRSASCSSSVLPSSARTGFCFSTNCCAPDATRKTRRCACCGCSRCIAGKIWRARWNGRCVIAPFPGRLSSASSQHRPGPAPPWSRWPSRPRNISTRFCGKLLWHRGQRLSTSLSSKKRTKAMKLKKTKAKTTAPTDHLRERCQSHFLTLRIPVEPAALDELLARAEKESLSHLRFLDLLLGAQAGARRERAVARRIHDAHFAESKTLEGFNWEFNPKAFDRVQIEELATGDFIRRRTNLLLVGWSGVGKSHIIQALGQRACMHGYRVLYRTSAQLLTDLTASLADKTLPAKLRRYANPDLLVIDEFGFDRIERTEFTQAAHLPYKSITARNQKRSTALVTNVDFDKWGEYLSDGPLAMAFLDRLVDGAIILKVKGKSYRAPQVKPSEDKPS